MNGHLQRLARHERAAISFALHPASQKKRCSPRYAVNPGPRCPEPHAENGSTHALSLDLGGSTERGDCGEGASGRAASSSRRKSWKTD